MFGYTDTTAVAGKLYYYTVTTVTADNQSAQSEEVSIKTQSAQLPAPTLSETSSTGTVKLTWTATTGATGYDLFRTDPVLGLVLYQQGITGTTFTDSSLISGVDYTYYVAAVSVSGMGIVSQGVTGTP
jgi:fibronectin type 3 domain-containing protein